MNGSGDPMLSQDVEHPKEPTEELPEEHLRSSTPDIPTETAQQTPKQSIGDASSTQSISPASSEGSSGVRSNDEHVDIGDKPEDKANKGDKKGKTSSKKKKNPQTLSEIKRRSRAERAAVRSWGFNIEDEMSELTLGSTLKILKRKGTGLLYDDRMLAHKCPWDENFPERPERISQPYQRCVEYGLVERCVKIPARRADENMVLSLHSDKLLEAVQSCQGKDLEQLQDLARRHEDVYFCEETYDCALWSLGSSIALTEQIIRDEVDNGMAIVRPPGHHASRDDVCGYSYFNNVAIAAKHALDKMGLNRILIVDWDVHHGQGTQSMFYNDPRVLYISIHRYEFGNFWPNLRESNYDFIGDGEGTGYNINVPLNKIGMSNSDYLAIFQQVLIPVAYEFHPELTLVSAGYDSCLGDAKGEMQVTPACYAHFIHMLSSLANGKLGVILEGGYCLKSLSEGVALTVRALLGDPCPRIGALQQPCSSVVESILNVIRVLQPHWKCFQYHARPEQSSEISSTSDDYRLTAPFVTADNRPDTYDIEDCYPVMDEDLRLALNLQIDALINSTDLSMAGNKTCLVYDEQMRKHKNSVDTGHPERPDRITRIFTQLNDCGLVQRCNRLSSRMAEFSELSLVHKPDYIDKIQNTKYIKPRDLNKMQAEWRSIYLTQDTYDCACMSCGSLLNIVDDVCTGKSGNGVAIIRPPGHHAEAAEACGFCLFNNVAVATSYVQSKYSTHGIKRILILDWDIHHGNGTQHMFDQDPNILYISLHRYDFGLFFPASEDADFDKVGSGRGKGFNVNIPWNKRGMGDPEYIASFQLAVMPIAYQFDPDLVIVSAGFDAARGDPLGGCNITPIGYAHLTHSITSLAGGKVILALEGGYNLNSISESMAMCTSILLGDRCPSIKYKVPCPSAIESLSNVLDTQKQYWPTLQFKVEVPSAIDNENNSNNEVSSANQDNTKSAEVSSTIDDVNKVFSAMSVSNTSEDVDSSEGACGGAPPNTQQVDATFLGANQQTTDAVQMFAVVPINWCPHLELVEPVPGNVLDVFTQCQECDTENENWVCLQCYEVYCGRFINEHMLFHGIATDHKVVLSYADLSVWCYGCDSYVHNEILFPAKCAAHLSKFGEDIQL